MGSRRARPQKSIIDKIMITLITEPQDYSIRAISAYKSLGKVYFLPALAKEQARSIKQSANILVIGLKYKIDRSWFRAMPNLKVIAVNTTGLNHIDLIEAKNSGVRIISLKGQSGFLKYVPSTAEKTFGLIFALARNLPWAFDHVKNGGWQRDLFRGHQLFGKTIGLLGFGRLGKLVAKYAHAFGMNVLAYDPYVAQNVFKRHKVERVAMDTLFKKSDILSVHAYLTDETKNLIQEKHFRLMKPSAYFVNTARGEIVNEGALLKALQKKWIAGAALDVLHNESIDGSHLKGNQLVDYARASQNLIIVPHIGGATFEAMEVTQDFIAELVLKFFKANSK